jgi:regulator of protease activity HflC (stomatin/prohibitin superfamily)
MFDRLLDIILQFLDLFKFWITINEFERGVILRLGRYHKTLEPGLHFFLPFGFDQTLTDNTVPRTVNLGEQGLTTHDGKTITVSAVVTAKISDIRKALIEVEHVDEALMDSCYATIGDLIVAHDWDTVRTPEFTETVTKACRKQAWRYGLEVLRVQFADRIPSKAIRLLQS